MGYVSASTLMEGHVSVSDLMEGHVSVFTLMVGYVSAYTLIVGYVSLFTLMVGYVSGSTLMECHVGSRNSTPPFRNGCFAKETRNELQTSLYTSVLTEDKSRHIQIKPKEIGEELNDSIQMNNTAEHILQRCLLLQTAIQMCGSSAAHQTLRQQEKLEKTATFILQTGLSV